MPQSPESTTTLTELYFAGNGGIDVVEGVIVRLDFLVQFFNNFSSFWRNGSILFIHQNSFPPVT